MSGEKGTEQKELLECDHAALASISKKRTDCRLTHDNAGCRAVTDVSEMTSGIAGL